MHLIYPIHLLFMIKMKNQLMAFVAFIIFICDAVGQGLFF